MAGIIVLIMLMIGSPGTGKTMLAGPLPTILPPLTPSESLETTRVYSALGRPAGRLAPCPHGGPGDPRRA